MRFWLVAVTFVLTAMLMPGMVYLVDEHFLAGASLVFTLSGCSVALVLMVRRYIYSGMLFGYHVGMTTFTTWVFINRDRVLHEKVFVFSAFTDANLQRAVVTLVTASLTIFLFWIVLARGRRNLLQVSIRTLAHELLGHLDRLPREVFQLTLISSFVLGVLFFITNTSVLEISYPFQSGIQWVPGEIQKIPTLAATGALAFAYARRIQRGSSFASWLLIAKVNFLIVTILMLFLVGSRGLFTFIWLGFGVLELVLWKKRRGSLGWGVLFVALAWFSYISWPYMRAYLAESPMDEVLMQALQIGVGLGDDVNPTYAGQNEILLGNIPMHGMSLFHLLYVIQLIQDGVSLAGSTFANLIPQSLPSWLDGILWERPLNDNWLLGDYYYHGGGFLLVANAYWNGGLWVALLFVAVLSAIFVGFDRYLMRPDVGLLYRAVYWLWLPVMIVQMGYGIQGMARIVQLLAVVILLERFQRRRARARGSLFGIRAVSRALPDRFTGRIGK